jgi:NADPH2:quinone reductase
MNDSIPTTMRVINVRAPGGPEALALDTWPVPTRGDGEVLIRVAAAGVNRADIYQRQGQYPPPAGASPILGMEVAGVVVACGPSAPECDNAAVRFSSGSLATDTSPKLVPKATQDSAPWRVGDPVCALIGGGGYAEYCVAPAPQCLPIPAGLSMEEAASLPETCFTVWANVFGLGRLAAAEVFLVHGGSSGIGITAIQLARQFGARVVTTAGSDTKCEACRSLGADLAINYRTQDFVAETKRFTDGHGADVILDMVGGPYLTRNIETLAQGGRLVHIATQQGRVAQIDIGMVMAKRLTVTGSTMRGRSVAEKGVIARELREKVWPLYESGAVKPVIDRAFPLAEASMAHALMESSRHIGKIVLTMAS